MSIDKKPAIDLIIPGLLNLPIHELSFAELASSTPALHKLLRYASRVPAALADVDEILIRRLGLQQAALPFAHAIRPQHKGPQLLFKPVHLKADINNAIVYPVNSDEDKLLSIINDLTEFFKDDCEVISLPDNRWLMTLLNCEPVTEVPHYLTALGKKVTHYLEQSKANLEWFKLFNEMQMFLYQHEVNQHRQQTGQLLINSLWCWGADQYQGEKLTDTLWFSDDSDMRKIGELYAGNADYIENIKLTDITSNMVIIDLSILKLLKGNDDLDTHQVLQYVEENCFEVLMKTRKHQIIVHTGGGFNFHYGAMSDLKFWKKYSDLREVILQSQPQH